jgi:invasion protein IalB
MNSSMDRSNTFRSLAGSALSVAFALAMGISLAVAQEGQPVPKTTVPKAVPATPAGAPTAAPVAGAPAAGAQGGAEESAWVKLCLKNEQTNNKQVCLVNHEGLEPNTGMVLVAAAVRSIEGEEKQNLLVRLPTAYSLIMPAGVQIKIDDSEPITLQYAVCFPTSCQVQMELTKEIFDKMRKGKQMIVAAMNMQQKTMAFPVPLTGFSKTYDGPPVDNAKYEEARRSMMEKFRQRQIELANKAAEAEQKKGQAGGAAQANGTPAPGAAPNATVAPQKMLTAPPQ